MGREETPSISLKRLYRPRKEGGIDLLDIEARNIAIEVSWLKKYLNTSGARPAWTFVTDAITNCIKPDGIKCLQDVNIFLSSMCAPAQPRENNPTKK